MTPRGDRKGMSGSPLKILVIRAWLEPEGEPSLRVRVLAVRPSLPDQQIISSTSVDDVCEVVRRWLIGLEP